MRGRCMLLVAVFAALTQGLAQEQLPTMRSFPISYVAAGSVYITGGRAQGLAVGDTVRIGRRDTLAAVALISAVAENSSVAPFLTKWFDVHLEDSAQVVKLFQSAPTAETTSATMEPQPPAHMASQARAPAPTEANLVRGRVALQYLGIMAEDSRLNLNRPSVVLQLSVNNLLGSRWRLDLNDRSAYDASNRYGIFGHSDGLTHRLYRLSLSYDAVDKTYGFGIGRLYSRFVPTLGSFDGGSGFFRFGQFSAGVAGGYEPDGQLIDPGKQTTKGAVFLHFESPEVSRRVFEGTLGYARQMAGKSLDREYLLLTTTTTPGDEWTIVQSADFDFAELRQGVRTSGMRLSNAMIFAHCSAIQNLDVSFGYDASRPVYLLETWKTLADSLRDRTMVQGFRTTATLTLSPSATVTGTLGFNTKRSAEKGGWMAGGGARVRDIFQTRINGEARGTFTSDAFTTTMLLSADIERQMLPTLSASLRFTYFHTHLDNLQQSYTTMMGSADLFWTVTGWLYASLAVDGVLDDTVNSVRIASSLGIRF
jgi:hypothetical protein